MFIVSPLIFLYIWLVRFAACENLFRSTAKRRVQIGGFKCENEGVYNGVKDRSPNPEEKRVQLKVNYIRNKYKVQFVLPQAHATVAI